MSTSAVGSTPLKSRKTLLWAVPAGASVCAAGFAWLCGAKDKKGYLRAIGAAAIGALVCVVRSSDLAKIFSYVADVFRKAGDPHGSLSPVASYQQRLPRLKPAQRDDALQRIKKDGSDVDLQTAIQLELKAFSQQEFAPGVQNAAVKGTELNHRQLVENGIAQLSPSFALPALCTRLAEDFHAGVIQPEFHETPEKELNAATKLQRMEKARTALHPLVYTALLRQEGAPWYTQKTTNPARANDIVDKMQMAAAACNAGEITQSTFLQVAEDGIAELNDAGMEHLTTSENRSRLQQLQQLIRDPQGPVKIRQWSATVYEQQAQQEARAFSLEMHDPLGNPQGDRPPIQQLHVATKRLSHLAFPHFARMAIAEMWAEASENLRSLDQVPPFRDQLRTRFKEGVLPESKSCLYQCLDESIARTVVSDFENILSGDNERILGSELTAAVRTEIRGRRSGS